MSDKPDFSEKDPRIHPRSDDDLDINWDRALLVSLSLLNVGLLLPDLNTTSGQISELDDITPLAQMLADDANINTEYVTIPPLDDITASAVTFVAVVEAFLNGIGLLWGVDANMALAILAQDYEAETGFTFHEAMDWVQGALAVVATGLLIYITAGGALPAGITAGGLFTTLMGAGLISNGTQLFDDLVKGRITIDEFILQAIIVATVTRVGMGTEGFLARIYPALTNETKLALSEWIGSGMDITTGLATDQYSSGLEALIAALQKETGLSRSEIINSINSTKTQMSEQQQLASDLAITPTEDATHRVPLDSRNYTDEIGSDVEVRLDPYTTVTVNSGISNELNAWFDARAGEYTEDLYGKDAWTNYQQQVANAQRAPGVSAIPVKPVPKGNVGAFDAWLSQYGGKFPPGYSKNEIIALAKLKFGLC